MLPSSVFLALSAAPPAGWAAAWMVRYFAPSSPRPPPIVWLIGLVPIFLWAALAGPVGGILAASLILGWALAVLAAIDLFSFRLPDALTLPLLLAGLAVSLLLPDRPVPDHLAGAAVGWGALAGLAWAYRRVRGVDGLGLGDAKLLGAAGAWLGWTPLPSVLIIACLVAFIWVGARTLRGGGAAGHERLAFGAPLSLAVWIVWLHGPLVR